jgi:hypothetical protein
MQLRYPQAKEAEQVGDPAGDVNADLIFRPDNAASGVATFVVDGKRVKVKARRGLFAIPKGAHVSLPRGAARDRFGNANGNGL